MRLPFSDLHRSRMSSIVVGLPRVHFLMDTSAFFMRNEISSEDVQKCQNFFVFTILILQNYKQWRN